MWLLALVLAAYIDLIQVHDPSGRKVLINPHEITSVREPVIGAKAHLVRGTHCIIVMANGQFVATREDCEHVKELLVPPP